jgi:hypothetical protein
MRIVAFMIIRNEEACLPRCLEVLGEQGLTVAVIDNDSTDRTPDILESFSPHVVTHVEHAPFTGVFEWIAMLKQADRMRDGLEADWFHLNSPDEIMTSNRRGETLFELILRVDSEGYSAINYDEFVFLPPNRDLQCEGQAFDDVIRHYYFFQPRPVRQIRSWKNITGITCVEGAGHRPTGQPLTVYPESQALRHYIALNAEEYRRKYGEREFNQDELDRGLHARRLHIDANQFPLPDPADLKELSESDPSLLDRSDPWIQHFWEPEAEAAR